MRCPVCQAENKETAKFCKQCGVNLEKALSGPEETETRKGETELTGETQPVKIQPRTCPGCNNPLNETAKFCRICGRKVEPGESAADKKVTVPFPAQTAPSPSPAPQFVQGRGPEKKDKDSKKQSGPKKSSSNTGLIIVAVILAAVLMLAAVFAVVLVKSQKISFEIPVLSQKDGEVSEGENESETEESEAALQEEEIEKLLDPIDQLAKTGREEIENDEKLSDGIGHLKDAVEQYLETAASVNNEDIMADRLKTAYGDYCAGILKQIDMLDGQPLDGGVGGRYGQMIAEMESALEVAAKVEDAGYEADADDVKNRLDEIKKEYPEKLIRVFNEFTEREQWSRTESWELMSGTFDGGMFDSDDLDNPVRLRYAYALAWFVQKENAEGVANGDKTPKAAAEYIAELIKDADYSPLLLREYLNYCEAAGRDSTEVQAAYYDIIEHIADTQGLRIGEDVDLEHFWYFNDFGEYSVDDTNGVTKENRDWIRNRMANVAF